MKIKHTFIILSLLALLFVTACGNDSETVDEGDGYSLVDLGLDNDVYELGDILQLSYTIAEPALDPDTGEYDVYVNLDITRDGEPYDAYPQIEHRTAAELPLELAHTVELAPDIYIPGDYDIHLMVTNRIQDVNDTLEHDLSFTIQGAPETPTPTEGPGSTPNEETAAH